MPYLKEVEVARNIALEVGAFQLEKLNSIKNINLKKDRSPVTEVDQKSEEIIKKALLTAYPEDGFLGEESKPVESRNNRTWIVDPLDGTRPFIRGIPTFSTMIGLEEDGEPVAGVIHFPALKESYYGSIGEGSYMNGEKIEVSKCGNLQNAMGSALGIVESYGSCVGQQALKLFSKVDYNYGFMDAYSYVSVASGKMDFAIGIIDTVWDRAAAAAIIKEAGGEFSGLKGEKSYRKEAVIFSNGKIHDKILEFFD